MEWIHIVSRHGQQIVECDNEVAVSIKCGIVLGQLRKYYDSKWLSSVKLYSASVCDQLAS